MADARSPDRPSRRDSAYSAQQAALQGYACALKSVYRAEPLPHALQQMLDELSLKEDANGAPGA